MPESNKIKELLNKYYEKLNNKEDFSFLLSDDFLLTGTVNKETKGKIDYINNNFF